jgi:hypothetical protein
MPQVKPSLPWGILSLPWGILSLPWGILSLPWGILSLPWGILSLPWGILSLSWGELDAQGSLLYLIVSMSKCHFLRPRYQCPLLEASFTIYIDINKSKISTQK